MLQISEEKARHIPHDSLIRIKANWDALKNAERRAAKFIIDNAKTIGQMGIVECASAAGASEATFVRLARRLGYSGFPALKEVFSRGVSTAEAVIYRTISSNDNPLVVVQKVFESSMQALRDTLSMIDRRTYRKAMDALSGASKVLFCGLGDAGLVAMAAYQKFARITTSCMASEDPDVQLIMASHLEKGDVVVAISHSGRSRTVLDTIKTAREHGATVIGIMNFPSSPLAKVADMTILTADFSEHLNGEVVSKRVSELCIIESLYINYLLSKGRKAYGALEKADKAVRINKV